MWDIKADDIVIITESENDLQINLMLWNRELEEYGIILNKNYGMVKIK